MIEVKDIIDRKSVYALRYVLNGYVLEDFQTVDALTAIVRKVAVLSHDTGMGKTVIASAIIKMLHNQDPNRKFLFVCKVAQFIQTPKDLAKATGLKVLAVSSKREDLENYIHSLEFVDYDIVVLAEEVFSDPAVVYTLRLTNALFTAIFIDEAHEMTNYLESDRAAMLKALLPYYEYRFALTATPMTTSLDQFSRLLQMLEPGQFKGRVVTLTNYLKSYSLESDYPGLYIRRSRRDIGVPNLYENKIVFVDPMPDQVGVSGNGMFLKTKGPGALNQVNKLIEIIKEESETPQPLRRKGLVYIWRHEVREWVESKFKEAGIKYACINGKTSRKNKRLYQEQFNKGDLDVIITSVTTSLNLDCDYVIFYEFTVDAKQFIGRSERGLISKKIRIYYMFTKDTGEIEFFLHNIYERSLVISSVLQKDYNMLIRAAMEVKQLCLK